MQSRRREDLCELCGRESAGRTGSWSGEDGFPGKGPADRQRPGLSIPTSRWRARTQAKCSPHERVTPDATEGQAKDEVTVGGVDANERSAKTMESRSLPGRFLVAGRRMCTGQVGGCRFPGASASGFSAGQSV